MSLINCTGIDAAPVIASSKEEILKEVKLGEDKID